MWASEKIVVWAGGLIFCSTISGFGYASTMGSLLPHDVSSSSGKQQQWVPDPRNHCVAAVPDFAPEDSISWQGLCHASMVYGPGTLVVNAPGSSHSVSSPRGCLVLVVWDSPPAFT